MELRVICLLKLHVEVRKISKQKVLPRIDLFVCLTLDAVKTETQ